MEYQSWEEHEAARKQKAEEFEQAKHALFMAICNALRIPQIVEWLTKLIKHGHDWDEERGVWIPTIGA